MTRLFTCDFRKLYDPTNGFKFIGWDPYGTGASLTPDSANGQGGNQVLITPSQNRRLLGARRVNNLTYIRQAFELNPAGVTIPTTRTIVLARNYHNDASRAIYQVGLRYTDGTGYQVYGTVDSNSASQAFSSLNFTLDNQAGKNIIEFDINCSDTTGQFRLWINGVIKWTQPVVNGNLRINWPSIGSVASNYAMSGSFGIGYWTANDDGAELLPPAITSAAIANANPDRVVVVFSENVVSADFTDGLVIDVNGTPATISSAILQADENTLWVTLSSGATSSDTVTLSYSKTSGDIIDEAGNTLPNYTDLAVTNNVLPPAPPEITSIGTTSQYVLSVLFNETVHSTSFVSGVSITVNGGAAAISSGILQGDGTTVLYTITTMIKPRDVVLWSYNSATGAILDEDNAELVTVANHAVTNNTRQQYLAWIDFEDGASPWGATSIENPDGDIAVGVGGALNGTANGATITLDDNTNVYFTIDFVNSSSGYLRARFYIDPNTLTMGASEAFNVLQFYNGSGQALAIVVLNYISSAYRISASAYNDAATTNATSAYAVTDAPHYVEIQLDRGAGSGTLVLLVDGLVKQTVSSIDNDTRFASVGSVLFGALGVDTGSRGTYFIDELVVIDRNEAIGA